MSVFQKPVVQLVFVDDNEDWGRELKTSFEVHSKQWSLYRAEQCEFRLHNVRSYEAFRRVVTESLSGDDPKPVYATLDLEILREDGDDQADSYVWQELIPWCLKLEETLPAARGRFEFCIISKMEGGREKVFSNKAFGKMLTTRDVNFLSSEAVQNGETQGRLQLEKIWESVREFARHHVPFSTIPVPAAGQLKQQQLLWWGQEPELTRFRELAERIAQRHHLGAPGRPRPKGAVYLLFANCAGFEGDWFRFVCHLCGIERWVHKDLGRLARDPDWDDAFANPRDALLVSGISVAAEMGFSDLVDVIQGSNFFQAVRDQGKLAFFQFPDLKLNGAYDAELKLDPEEFKTLKVCLKEVNAEDFLSVSQGMVHADHSQLIRFPTYEALKRAGLIERTIEFESNQACERYGIKLSLDPEVKAVLSGIHWNEPAGERHSSGVEESDRANPVGLNELRVCIQRAYASAAADKSTEKIHVGVQYFERSRLAADYSSVLGFSIRGARLHDALEHQNSWDRKNILHSEPVRGLQIIYELYDSLSRLVALHDELSKPAGATVFSERFDRDQYGDLLAAHRFLKLVFRSPDNLRNLMRSIQRRGGTSHTPTLHDQDGWQELVKSIDFEWPYWRFRLPAVISEYLNGSDVIAEFHSNFPVVFGRYPHLQAEWKALEDKRHELMNEAQTLEAQRRSVLRHIEREHTQPVLARLHHAMNEKEGDFNGFNDLLESFVFFNAFVAICENVYVFGGKALERRVVKNAVENPQLGASVGLLTAYLKKLRAEKKLSESVFKAWNGGWAVNGRQEDAIRLAKELGHRILHKYSDGSLTPGNITNLEVLAKATPGTPVDSYLDALLTYRIVWDKYLDTEFSRDLADFLCRLATGTDVAVTKGADSAGKASQRIGLLKDDGRSVHLWHRSSPEVHHLEAPSSLRPVERRQGSPFDRVVLLRGDPLAVTFPIDDLIRLHRETTSVLASRGNNCWVDLALHGVSLNDRRYIVSPSTHTWLPTHSELLEMPVWK